MNLYRDQALRIIYHLFISRYVCMYIQIYTLKYICCTHFVNFIRIFIYTVALATHLFSHIFIASSYMYSDIKFIFKNTKYYITNLHKILHIFCLHISSIGITIYKPPESYILFVPPYFSVLTFSPRDIIFI